MLVLSRKLNEKVVINENVVITVVEAGNGKVRLGIEAPSHVPVHRQEVYERIAGGESQATRRAGSRCRKKR